MKTSTIHIIQHLAPGGIETLVMEMVKSRMSSHNDYIICLESPNKRTEALLNTRAEIRDKIIFLNKKEGFDIFLILKIFKHLILLKPEVVHTHHIGPLIYGSIAARLAVTPVLLHTEHDAWHLENAKHIRLQKRILKVFKPVLVADAGMVKRILMEKIPGITPFVIYNGIDHHKFEPSNALSARLSLGLPMDKKIIGCAGRMHPIKGHEILIKALAKMPDDVHLAFAGSGEELNALKSFAEHKQLTHRVHFLGNLNNMSAFYNAIDVFSLASRNEGFPLSPLEAQACGKPVVISNVGGCCEAVDPATGHLVDVGDIDGFAKALKNVLANNKSQDPRQFVLQGKSLVSMLRQYTDLVRNIKETRKLCY